MNPIATNCALDIIDQIPTILEKCRIGSKGCLMKGADLGTNKFGVTLVPESELDTFSEILENLVIECSELTPVPHFK